MINTLTTRVATAPTVIASQQKAIQAAVTTTQMPTIAAPVLTTQPILISSPPITPMPITPMPVTQLPITQTQLPITIIKAPPTKPLPTQESIDAEFARIYKQISNNIVGNQIKNFKFDPKAKPPNLAQMNSLVYAIGPFVSTPLTNAKALLTSIDERMKGLQATNPNHPDLAKLKDEKSQLDGLVKQLESNLNQIDKLKASIKKELDKGNGGKTDLIIGFSLMSLVTSLKTLIASAEAVTKKLEGK